MTLAMLRLIWLVSAVFALSCVVLPQQVAAQANGSSVINLGGNIPSGKQNNPRPVEEGATIVLPVQLSLTVEHHDVILHWTVTETGDNPATLDGDDSDLGTGQDITGMLVFPKESPPETVRMISIATNDDVRVEEDETFTVTLSAPPGGLPEMVEFATIEAQVAIIDNDRATVSINPARASRTEGGTFTFDISLSHELTTESVTVTWTVAESGTNPATIMEPNSDLGTGQDITSTVVFNAGETTPHTITITTDNDNIVEGDETFTVTLSAPPGSLPDGVNFANATADATITETETATVSINPAEASQAEGAAFDFTVTLSQAAEDTVTVTWTAAESGDNPATLDGDDSDLGTGQDITGTAVFNAGETTPHTVTITTNDDNIVEGDETFTVTLTGDLPDGVDFANTTADATITETETATVSINPAEASQAEGGVFNFTVTLSQAAEDAVTVTWTAAESGTNTATLEDDGSDLATGQDITGTAVFNAGETTPHTVTITTNDDNIVEGNETFTVTLTGDLPDGVDFANTTADATITETETATVSINPAEASQAEGGTFTFDVSLSHEVENETVTVTWTAAESGTNTATLDGNDSDLGAGQDVTDTIVFNAGETEPHTITITTNDDNIVEGDETFTVTLTGDLPDGVDFAGTTADATITETETATVSINPAEASQAEGGTFTFDVSLSHEVENGAVTVTWTAAESGTNTATLDGNDSDLGAGQDVTDTIVFNAGETTPQTITITTNDDNIVEGNETFTVTLTGNLPDGVDFANATADATITETETATVSINPAEASQTEGGTFTFDVSLSHEVENEAVTVTWTAAESGTNTATLGGNDSDLVPGQDVTDTIVFNAGETTPHTVTITTNDDNIVEGDETFTVTLTGNLPDGVDFANATADATITETETATVSINPAEASQTEGGTFTFDVSLSHEVENEAVTVTWTAAESGTNTATLGGNDSDLVPGQDVTSTIVFNAGETTPQTITITTSNDTRVEGDETFTVTLTGNLPDGVDFANATADATITETATATVSINPAEASQAEGGTFTFDVSLSHEVENEAVTVTWTAAESGNNPATLDGNGSDLVPGQDITGTIVFNAGETTPHTITITTNNDTRVESDETFTVTLTGNLPEGVDFANATADATITESEGATVSINPAEASQAEGGTFTFDVSLSHEVENEAVTVTWTAAESGNNPATLDGNGSDLVPGQDITGTIVFNAGETTPHTITITTNNDTQVEGDETFTVTLTGNLPEGVNFAGTTANATIIEAEAGRATVSIDPASASRAEGTAFDFTITLSQAAEETVTVTWTAAESGNNPATLDGDDSDLGPNQDITGTIVFNAGETAPHTITITTNNDDIAEGYETFTVTLTGDLPQGVDFANTTANATITEDETATVSINPARASRAEGTAFDFTITLSQAAQETVTVTWTAAESGNNPATLDGNDSDLVPSQDITGTAVFNAGETTPHTVTITTNNDTRVEGDETFTVTLTGDLPQGVDFANTTANATITEDEIATVSIDPPETSQAEGAAFDFTITLSRATEDAVTVTWTAAESGNNPATLDGNDSDLVPGQDITGTVIFNAGETTPHAITIITNNDTRVESDETFTVNLTGDLPQGVEFANTTANATIIETGDGRATVFIDPAETSQAEGGTFTFDVSLSHEVENENVTVTWTAAGSGNNPATLDGNGSDLVPGQDITGTVVFNAGDIAPHTITIITNDDDIAEGDETFTVTLTGDLPEGVDFANATANATIIEAEDDIATVSIEPPEASQAEGTVFNFTVILSQAAEDAITVTWTAAESGNNPATLDGDGSDLGPNQDITGTAVFNAGETTPHAITIITNDDDIAEGDETFTVTLTGDLPQGVEFAGTTANATITENDRATVSIDPPEASQVEGAAFDFTVILSRAAEDAVTVTWTAAESGDNPATLDGDGSDLGPGQEITGTAVFNAGETTPHTVTITINDDDIAEGDETFTVTLTGDLPQGVEFAGTTTNATITENEDEAATVSIDPPEASQVEGAAFDFTVTLSRAAEDAVTVTWTAAESGDNPATLDGNGSDLGPGQDITGTAIFNAGETAPHTVTITTNDDDIAEGDETFTVTLTGDLPGGVNFANTIANATITEDETATVSIKDADPVAENAGPARFTVCLSRAADSDVVLNISYVPGSATLEDLGSPLPTTVTIAAGATEAVFEVPIADDDIAEGDETFTVTLTGDLPQGVVIADGSAIGTISQTPESSVLIEPRRIAAGTALRRHVSRFDKVTGTVVRNRLKGSGIHDISLSAKVVGDAPLQDITVSSQPFKHHWGLWVDGAWTEIRSNASGRQADLYGGMDYMGHHWLIGILVGYELADLEIGETSYESDYIHFGLYGGVRLSKQLLFDGAATYGMATPEVTLENLSATYDANRFTARGDLTGNFGFKYGSVTVEPQLGMLYSRETLGAFTDSGDGVAPREVLKLGRLSAGPRLTWDFKGGWMASGGRLQWDGLQLEDGVRGPLSGAADIGLKLNLASGVTLGVQGHVDGIGITDDFVSLGGNIDFNVRF